MFVTISRPLFFPNTFGRSGGYRLGRLLLLLSLSFVSSLASAVILDRAILKTGQGARLLMEVELKQVSAVQARTMKFALLPGEQYANYGLKYHALLSRLRFTIKRRSNGQYYLRVSSSQVINVPALSIALMLSTKGKLAGLMQVYHLDLVKRRVTVVHRPAQLKRRPKVLSQSRASKSVETNKVDKNIPAPVQTSKDRVTQKSLPLVKPEALPAPPPPPPPVSLANGNVENMRSEHTEEALRVERSTTSISAAEGSTRISSSAAEVSPAKLERYKVKLSADAQIQKPGPPGVLSVWIGDPSLTPASRAGTTSVDTTIAAVGETAKVTPFAPMFIIEPAEYACIKIDPTGSEARFSLTPKESGTYEVGATVALYETADCSGPPVPKPVTSLKVNVVVNAGGVVTGYVMQLWEKLWSGFLDFWGWVVATFFALLMFLIRKKLKKWFGFVDTPAGN